MQQNSFISSRFSPLFLISFFLILFFILFRSLFLFQINVLRLNLIIKLEIKIQLFIKIIIVVEIISLSSCDNLTIKKSRYIFFMILMIFQKTFLLCEAFLIK